MARIVALFALLTSLFITAAARAEDSDGFAALLQPRQAVVAQVIDPLRLRLADGTIVQLAGIEVPDLDPLEAGDNAVAALAALRPLLEGKQIRLYQTKDPQKGRTNRMGYMLAHVVLSGETPIWAQEIMLAAGFARVRVSASNPEMAAQMNAIEARARQDKLGLWADPAHAIRTADNAHELTGRFGIIEGRIHAVAVKNNMVFLNFGEDWRKDFTIGIEGDTRRAMTRARIDPQTLGGKAVRVRGWVEEYNGPFIRLLDLQQIEFTD